MEFYRHLGETLTYAKNLHTVTGETDPEAHDMEISVVSEGCFDRHLRTRRRPRTPFVRWVRRCVPHPRFMNQITPVAGSSEFLEGVAGLSALGVGVPIMWHVELPAGDA